MMKQHLRCLPAGVAIVVALAAAGCSKAPEMALAQPAAAASAGAGTTTAPATTTTATTNVSDVDITEHVKTALQQAASLMGTDIAVVTTKGDVRLTAVLDNQAQIDDALRIARAADGAHSIHDELTLRK
jgi:osmotically-inducible protein OsmY